MTPAEAAQILNIAPDAAPEQIEAQFQAQRQKLEDRIAKAPTPGLKAKYRESLDAITQAFETLTLAADGSVLPVVKKHEAIDHQRSAVSHQPPAPGSPLPAPGNPKSPIQNRKSNREILVVALVAVLVLAGGGWFILKIRADNAEKARIAAEQKAESEHQAALAKRAAEAKRLAEEQEKARVAAAAKAEQERLDKVAADTRVKLAEIRVAWDAFDQKAKSEERKISDLKSDERNLSNQLKGASSPDLLKLRAELAAEQEFSAWLSDSLVRHPARVARVQAEELLNAKQIDEAATAATHAQEELAKLDAEIAATSRSMLTLTGKIQIELSPADAVWQLTDAYGNKRTGTGPAEMAEVPFGLVQVHFSRRGFSAKDATATLRRNQPLTLKAEFVAPTATIESNPTGAEVWVAGELKGKTPASFALAGDGPARAQVRLTGYVDKEITLNPSDPASLKLSVSLSQVQKAAPVIPEKAWVTIIERKAFLLANGTTHIALNGEQKFDLNVGLYQTFSVSPGSYRITADPVAVGQKPADVDLVAEPGRRYYYKTWPVKGGFNLHALFEPMAESEARSLMAGAKEIGPPLDLSTGSPGPARENTGSR